MCTLLPRSFRVLFVALLTFAFLPAAARAQRRGFSRPFVPMPVSSGTFQHLHLQFIQAQQAALLRGAGTLNAAATHNTHQATTLANQANQAGKTPLQKATLDVRSGLLNITAGREKAAATRLTTLGHLNPTQVLALHEATMRDRNLADRTAFRAEQERLSLSSRLDMHVPINPYAPMNPYAMRPGAPYAMSPVNPYMSSYAGGYAMGYGGGYGMGYGYPPIYGMTNPYGTGDAALNPGVPAAPAAPVIPNGQNIGALFTALDVPMDGNKLSWPLGLRTLSPADTATLLRGKIDTVVQIAATQKPLAPDLVGYATDAIDELRLLLRANRGSPSMAEQSYQDASRFLDHLQAALPALEY